MPLLEDFVDEILIPVVGSIDAAINALCREIGVLRIMLPRFDIADFVDRTFNNGQALFNRTAADLRRQSKLPFIAVLAGRYLQAPEVYCLTLLDMAKINTITSTPGVYIRVVEFNTWDSTHSDTASVVESVIHNDRSPSSMSSNDDLSTLRDELAKLQQEVFRLRAVVDKNEGDSAAPQKQTPAKISAPPPPPPPPLPLNLFSKPAKPILSSPKSPMGSVNSESENGDENAHKKVSEVDEKKTFSDVLAELKNVQLRHVESQPRPKHKNTSNALKEAMLRRRFAFQENSESELSDSDASFT